MKYHHSPKFWRWNTRTDGRSERTNKNTEIKNLEPKKATAKYAKPSLIRILYSVSIHERLGAPNGFVILRTGHKGWGVEFL